MTSPKREWPVRQEDDTLSGRAVAGWMSAAAVATVVSALAAWGLLRAWEPSAWSPSGHPRQGPAEVGGVRQTLALEDGEGQRLRARQRAALDRAAWIDRGAGVARIPIDIAMDAVVEASR
ncbi:MAG: hypothetical protein R3A52_23170 [Polyangiales bacterium]